MSSKLTDEDKRVIRRLKRAEKRSRSVPASKRGPFAQPDKFCGPLSLVRADEYVPLPPDIMPPPKPLTPRPSCIVDAPSLRRLDNPKLAETVFWNGDFSGDINELFPLYPSVLLTPQTQEREVISCAHGKLGEYVEGNGIDLFAPAISDDGEFDPVAYADWSYLCLRLRQMVARGERVVVDCLASRQNTAVVVVRYLQDVCDVSVKDVEIALQELGLSVPALHMRSHATNHQPTEPGASQWRDRVFGCFLGGAVGDGFGYSIEFQTLETIRKEHGSKGLEWPTIVDDNLIVSDDTQMTLFTAEGLIRCYNDSEAPKSVARVSAVYQAYLRWLETQGGGTAKPGASWLSRHPSMRHARAPGTTCLSALQSGYQGTPTTPINNSKGCGGIMRVAPIAFLPYDRQSAFEDAIHVSALTHGHPSGYLSAGAFVMILHRVINGSDLQKAISETIISVNEKDSSAETVQAMQMALKLAADKVPPDQAIPQLGQGWVGEEALAIALYATLVGDNFEKAIVIAANHDGDSDSTASIAGQLYGAMHGTKEIPHEWIRHLDVLNPLLVVAHDIARLQEERSFGLLPQLD